MRIADAAGFDRFAVYSGSHGSLYAAHLVAAHPDRIRCWATVGGSVDGRLRRDGATESDPLIGLIQAGWQPPGTSFAEACYHAYVPDAPPDWMEGYARPARNAAPAERVVMARTACNQASIADLLPRIHCPVRVFHGRNDTVHPLAQARKLAAGIPGAELSILETANHIPIPGEPAWDGFLASLCNFLAQPAPA